MEKIQVEYEKMYYGFPVILVSYYDKNGNPNVTTQDAVLEAVDGCPVAVISAE